MINKFLRLLVILTLCGVLATAIMFLQTQPKRAMQEPSPPAGVVKIVQPIDLTGEWESVESKAGTKFLGHIKNNTVHIEMYVAEGYTGLWYGTFDILPAGTKQMISSAIQDEKHFVLSTAETKSFLYQDGSLIFEFSVMGTRTAIEMKKVK